MQDQRTKIARTLLKLSKDVTAEDRRAYTKKHKKSKVVVSNFLNGKVTNNDSGLEMIDFFSERIKIREAKLNRLCQIN